MWYGSVQCIPYVQELNFVIVRTKAQARFSSPRFELAENKTEDNENEPYQFTNMTMSLGRLTNAHVIWLPF